LPGEGGHVDLPLSSPRETQLWQHIHNEIGHVSAETALSGGGLPRVYRAICAVDGHEPKLDTPEAITAAGLAGDPIALEVLEQFCCWLGRVAGNNVLTTGGRGGVYIVGGVIPRFADFFLESGFARSFADKGCMSDYFKGIPVWLVTAPYSGLVGAGVALEQA
jgi:glucokinase